MKKIVLFLLIFLIAITAAFFLFKNFNNPSIHRDKSNKDSILTRNQQPSDSVFAFFLDSAMQSEEALSHNLSGRKISILITGVDARLGSTSVHADANHLLNFWLDSNKIEILSIPRGTFVDLGYNDSCNINYLANVRSLRGREKYQQAVKEIAGIDSIHYFVEFGFSQAIGLLELLGYKENSVQMLRVLRSRKSFGIGDYQRAYNQGQFIRQMLLTQFGKITGVLGELTLRAGLFLVDNNLNFESLKSLIASFKQKGFPKSPNDVIIRLVPKFNAKLSDFNFTDVKEIDSLYRRIAKSASGDTEITDLKVYYTDNISKRVIFKLQSLINNAKRDSEKNPKLVIKILEKPFSQRTWFQISNKKMRDSLRNDIYSLLIKAYFKTNNPDRAKYLLQVAEAEKRTSK